MTGLRILDRPRLPSVNLGKLSVHLVAGGAITAAEENTIGVAAGQLPVIMTFGGRGWSQSRGQMGDVRYRCCHHMSDEL